MIRPPNLTTEHPDAITAIILWTAYLAFLPMIAVTACADALHDLRDQGSDGLRHDGGNGL